MTDDEISTNEKVSETKKVPEPNKQWLDRRTAVDDLLAIVAELLIEGNTTQKEVLSKITEAITIRELIDKATDEIKDEDFEDKEIKPGDTGVSLSVCNSGNIGSFIIKGIIVNGIAKADITAYERVIVTPGGTSDEPYVVPLSILIKGNKGVIAQDDSGNLISMMYGSEGIVVKQETTGELISVIQGSEGVDVKQKTTGELVAEIVGSTGNAVAQDVNDKLISIMQGSQGNAVAQDASDRLIAMLYGSAGTPISQDAADNLIAVIKGNYAGSLVTVSVDSAGLMQSDVSKSEKISIIKTDKDTHFTSAIVQFNHETENLTGLTDNKIFIRGVNIQSDQNLKFRLIFWTKDTFADTDLDLDTYIDDVILDMSDTTNTFRINNTGQYYLNVSDLNILYEDEDSSNELHISLQNLSAVSKNAGATGEVQLDIKYAPRL